MANSYRPTQNKVLIPEQTLSAIVPDVEVPGVKANRAETVRRDTDKVVTPEVRFHDLEKAFKFFLTDHLIPTVTENGVKIPVPILYASPERWVSIQRDGFLRDPKGKIYAPLLSFRTIDFAKRQDLVKDDILKGTSEYFQYMKEYSSKSRYDNFSVLTNAKPVKEVYNVQVPDYVEANMEMTIWCDHREQLNEILDKLPFFSGKAFGDTFKFTVRMDQYPIEQVNTTGEDRLVRATIPVRMTGYILINDVESRPIAEKHLTKSKVVIITEVAGGGNPTGVPERRITGIFTEGFNPT